MTCDRGAGSGIPTVFQITGQDSGSGGDAIVSTISGCGDTKQSTVTFNLINGEDESGSTFDATGYLYGASGHSPSITDTTAGTATLNCGEEYELKLVRTDANAGDSSRLTGIAAGSIPNAKIVDGNAVFTPIGPTATVNLVGAQHGVLEFRAFDVDNNAFMFDDGDSSATDLELDGVRRFLIVRSKSAHLRASVAGLRHEPVSGRIPSPLLGAVFLSLGR